MSHDQHPAPRTHTVRASSGGGKWKWAAAAAAAAVILGGGYYALTNSNTPDRTDQFAYDETSPADDAFDTASLDETAPDTADESSPRAAPASTADQPARSPARRTQTAASSSAAADPVPLQVVGVSSDGEIAAESEDEIVVPGHRRPEWTRTPSEYRLTRAYPERALERGREGEAQVNCTVVENGALDCVRAAEYPENSGFGLAALRVARMFRHAPQRQDGSSAVGDPVNLRVVFRLADEDRRRG